MRKCVARVIMATTAAVLLTPQAADAGLLGWLSRLSGPGPFWGLEAKVAVLCPKDEGLLSIGLTVPCANSILTKRHGTWYILGGFSLAENNPLNYGDSGRQETSTAVRLGKVGASWDYTLFPSLDLGVGGGGFYFAGPRFANFWRVYGEARATFRPLVLLAFPKDDDEIERQGWLLLSVSRVVVFGTIKGSDFGAPLDPLNERNELLWSVGASVDVLRLLKNFPSRR